MRPVWGLMWTLVLVLPWFVLIFLRAGETFFAESRSAATCSASSVPRNPMARRPGSICCCSGSRSGRLRRSPAMAAPAIWGARREPGAQFLLAWLMPSWIVFEAVLTKLPHYVLPLYPAIAILTVGALERRVLSRFLADRAARPGGLRSPHVGVGARDRRCDRRRSTQPVFPAWPLFAVAMVFGLIAWWMFEDSRAERSLLNAVIAAALLAGGTYGVVLPRLTTGVSEPGGRAARCAT